MEHILRSKKFEFFMLFCILGYALFKISYRPLNDIFQALFILGFMASAFYDRHYLKKDPMVKLFGIAVIIQIAAWFHGTYFTPYSPKLSSHGLIDLFLFLPIAYFLKGNPKYIIWTLIAFCLGGILVVFTRNGSNTLPLFELGLLHGRRINLLFNNSNHPGLLGGALLLASLVLSAIHFLSIKNTKNKHNLAIIVITSLSFFIGISYVYISQARTTYLALFITLVFTPLIYRLFQFNIKKLITHTLPLTLFTLIVSFWILNVPSIQKRLTLDQLAWHQIFDGHIENIDTSSVGIRIRFWLGAKNQLQKYPLLGLGDTKAAGYTQDHSKYLSSAREKEMFRFIHNGHIEILLAFGLLGLFVLWGIYFYLIKITYCYSSQYKWLLTHSAIALTLYLFITNGFESYYIYKQGIFIHNLFIACIYSMPMFMHYKRKPQEKGAT